MEKSRWIRLTAASVLVLAVIISLSYLKDHVSEFLDWVRGQGNLGLVVLALAYIPAAVLFIPGTLLTLGGGFAFGVVKGTIAISIGATFGAAAAFLVSRYLARDLVEDKIKRYPRFQALDQAVAREGFKIVLLTRLSPVFPYTFLNYAYGLTKVGFRDYLLASWIGMLPGTVMYVYLGSLAGELTDVVAGKVEGGIGQKILFGVGLLATVAVTVFITRVARRALEQTIPLTTDTDN